VVNARFKFLIVTVAAALGVMVTASLGQWQLNRAAQKNATFASLQAQSTKAPLQASELVAHGEPVQLIHQNARLRGRWIQDKSVLLDNRQMNGRVGFSVVTPFALDNSSAVILVQRGWIARFFEDRSRIPVISTPVGVVEITGRIAPPPAKLFELSKGDLGTIRQNLDLQQYSVELATPLLAVTLLQTGEDSEGLSRIWPAPDRGVDKHYGYAFQWFGLAVLIGALYFWFQIFRRFIYRSKDPASHV
jgi:surfeit locus 1 family protein